MKLNKKKKRKNIFNFNRQICKTKKAFMYKSLFLLTKSLICGNIIIKQG